MCCDWSKMWKRKKKEKNRLERKDALLSTWKSFSSFYNKNNICIKMDSFQTFKRISFVILSLFTNLFNTNVTMLQFYWIYLISRFHLKTCFILNPLTLFLYNTNKFGVFIYNTQTRTLSFIAFDKIVCEFSLVNIYSKQPFNEHHFKLLTTHTLIQSISCVNVVFLLYYIRMF